jgi:hypothetical protein
VLDRTAPHATLALARTTLRKVVQKGFIPVNVTCDETCTIDLRARVARKLRKRLGSLDIASGKGTGQAGRRVTVKLKLQRKARRRLRRTRSLTFTLRATLADAAGNRGSAVKKTKLRRPRKR